MKTCVNYLDCLIQGLVTGGGGGGGPLQFSQHQIFYAVWKRKEFYLSNFHFLKSMGKGKQNMENIFGFSDICPI